MNKTDIEKLTKFIPALCSGELGEWSAENVTAEDISSCPAPAVEYWDVVHRFADAVLDLEEKATAAEDGTPEVVKAAVSSLAEMIRQEEECPGVLLGYIRNETVTRLLRRLETMEF